MLVNSRLCAFCVGALRGPAKGPGGRLQTETRDQHWYPDDQHWYLGDGPPQTEARDQHWYPDDQHWYLGDGLPRVLEKSNPAINKMIGAA